MSHMEFGPSLFCAALLALGCGRHDYYRPPPISSVRFYARVESSRGMEDTLRVRVSAQNRGQQIREINVGGCGHPIVIRAVSATTRRVAWDSWAWREAEITRLNARRDTTRDGHPILHGACTLEQSVQYLAPGDSADIATFAVPLRAVLGDSLSPGRYGIITRVRGNAWRAGDLSAGEVELRSPPT